MMIKRLRYTFIIMASSALLLVMLIMGGAIIGIAHWRTQTRTDQIMTILAQHNGELTHAQATELAHQKLGKEFTANNVFQYRYLIASETKQRHLGMVDQANFPNLPRATIAQLLKQAQQATTDHGTLFLDKTQYRFQKLPGQPTRYLFLDQTFLVQAQQDLMHFSVLIGLVCWTIFTTVIILISNRVLKPVIAAEQRQKRFITNAGHELKTPLAIISANNEMAEMLAGQTEWTTNNTQQIKRLTRLINNLINLARLDEDPEIKLTKVDASTLVNQVVSEFKPLLTNQALKLNYQVNQGVKVLANANYYTELCNILLDNAVKYCDPQGTVTVTLTKHSRGSELVIGNSYRAGANQDYTQFFDRFYRQDTAHQINEPAGFGIGLSMAQNLATIFHANLAVTYQHEQIFFHVKFRS